MFHPAINFHRVHRQMFVRSPHLSVFPSTQRSDDSIVFDDLLWAGGATNRPLTGHWNFSPRKPRALEPSAGLLSHWDPKMLQEPLVSWDPEAIPKVYANCLLYGWWYLEIYTYIFKESDWKQAPRHSVGHQATQPSQNLKWYSKFRTLKNF